MILDRCRVCSSKDVVRKLHLSGFPCHIWPLANEEERLFRDAVVYVCGHCGHIQLQDLESEFIRDLYVHETCNVEDPGANRSRVSAIEARYGAECFTGKRTLDIGGGRNAFTSHLPQGENWICDFDVVDDLKKPGSHVVEGDFLELDFPLRYFDYISMFHTLEHLNDPAAAVMRMADLLAPEGRILVEVPNARQVARTMPFYTVFHMHLSMFTPEVLTLLFARHGLSVQNWFRQDDVLFAAFTKEGTGRHSDVVPTDALLGHAVVADLETRLNALGAALSAVPLDKDPSRVGLYGAGGSSALFLAHFPEMKKKIGICFDQDSRKQGRFLPGTDIPICKPETMDQVRLEQLLFLSTHLARTVEADRAIQIVDIEQMIRTLPDDSKH